MIWVLYSWIEMVLLEVVQCSVVMQREVKVCVLGGCILKYSESDGFMWVFRLCKFVKMAVTSKEEAEMLEEGGSIGLSCEMQGFIIGLICVGVWLGFTGLLAEKKQGAKVGMITLVRGGVWQRR